MILIIYFCETKNEIDKNRLVATKLSSIKKMTLDRNTAEKKSNRFQILNIADIDPRHWDELAEISDEAWLWHLHDFQNILCTWPNRKNISFGLWDKNQERLVALIPLQLIEKKIVKYFTFNQLECLGGIAFRNSLSLREREHAKQTIEKHFHLSMSQHKAHQVFISISSLLPALRKNKSNGVNPLLTWGCENNASQTWVIDLTQNIERIHSGYNASTKREIKLLTGENIRFIEARNLNDLENYYSLHRETYSRTGVQCHPFDYFLRIFELLTEKGLSRMVLLEINDEIVAAQNSAIYKDAALYWTGCSKTDAPLGANRLLMNNQIEFAKKKGCKIYEVGEAFPNIRSGKLKGLSDYKKSFGGELVPYYRGTLHSKKKQMRYLYAYQQFRNQLATVD